MLLSLSFFLSFFDPFVVLLLAVRLLLTVLLVVYSHPSSFCSLPLLRFLLFLSLLLSHIYLPLLTSLSLSLLLFQIKDRIRRMSLVTLLETHEAVDEGNETADQRWREEREKEAALLRALSPTMEALSPTMEAAPVTNVAVNGEKKESEDN